MEEEPAVQRTSIAPSSPAGGALRLLFAIAWISGQMALVLTADRRSDAAFGFRMFPESSTIKIALYREIPGPGAELARVHVDGGEWTARDAQGTLHHFAWKERVTRPELQVFDREIFASYGARTQLARWQAALADVAAHTSDDAETRHLILEIAVRKNGREPEVVRFSTLPGGH